jgi:hypothetical protein
MPRGRSVQQSLRIMLAPNSYKSILALAEENNLSTASVTSQLITEALQARGLKADRTRWAELVDARAKHDNG